MKSNYIINGFQQTVQERFSAQSKALNEACMRRLAQLRMENKDASKEKQRHLEGQILPGIAVYETLKTVMTPEEAFRTVHGYVEAYALSARKMLVGLLRLPELYRLIPGISVRMMHKIFNGAAGFAANEYRTAGGVMRIDMVKCPYHETCVRYGCPELCACFCDSDDIAYDNMHPKLLWHRTKTLGRGGDCCDFGLRVKGMYRKAEVKTVEGMAAFRCRKGKADAQG